MDFGFHLVAKINSYVILGQAELVNYAVFKSFCSVCKQTEIRMTV